MLGLALLSVLGIVALADGDGSTASVDEDTSSSDNNQSTDDTVDSGANSSETAGDRNLVRGTDGADTLNGTSDFDIVFGRGGDDIVNSGASSDRVFGGEGNDGIAGGTGNDFLRGGSGDDTVYGDRGADTLRGDDGNDLIVSADIINASDQSIDVNADTNQPDEVFGGVGNDTLIVGTRDIVDTGGGNDTVNVGDWVQAGDDAPIINTFDVTRDSLLYSYSGDTVPTSSFGTDANNVTVLRVGDEIVARFPDLTVDQLSNNVTVEFEQIGADTQNPENTTADRSIGTDGSDIISTEGGNDVVFGNNGLDSIDAGAGNDRVFGGQDDDLILGGSGDDFLRGGSEDDILFGGEGVDSLRGDAGADTLVGANIVGVDEINVENLADLNFGTDSGDADTLIGGVGDDALIAGSNDSVDTGNGTDQLVLGDWITPGDSAVTVTNFTPGTDSINFLYSGGTPTLTFEADTDGTPALLADGEIVARFTNATLADLQANSAPTLSQYGEEGERIFGTDADESFVNQLGNGDNFVSAAGGNDTIEANGGNDTLFGRDGNDSIYTGWGNDTAFGGAGNDFVSAGLAEGADGPSATETADGDSLRGGSGDDTIEGWFGQDTLKGDDGNDVLDGRTIDLASANGTLSYAYEMTGGDADSLRGGVGDDTIIAGSGDTVDTGSGADVVKLGDWIGDNQAGAVIESFNPQSDSVVYSYFDQDETADAPAPDIAFTFAEVDGVVTLSAGDQVIATFPNNTLAELEGNTTVTFERLDVETAELA